MIKGAIDLGYLIESSCEGEPIMDEFPNDKISVLADDCYACDSCLLSFFKDGKHKGNINMMPYEASDVEEVIQDYHDTVEMNEIVKLLKTF